MTTIPRAWRDRPAEPEEEDAVIFDLDPKFAPFIVEMYAWLRARGHDPQLIYGRRSAAKQVSLVDGGFSKKLDSLHLHGLAADTVDSALWWGAAVEEEADDHPGKVRVAALWGDIGVYCELTDLRWGGLWKTPWDPAHVEWREGAVLLPSQMPNDFDDDLDTETTLDGVLVVEAPAAADTVVPVPVPRPLKTPVRIQRRRRQQASPFKALWLTLSLSWRLFFGRFGGKNE